MVPRVPRGTLRRVVVVVEAQTWSLRPKLPSFVECTIDTLLPPFLMCLSIIITRTSNPNCRTPNNVAFLQHPVQFLSLSRFSPRSRANPTSLPPINFSIKVPSLRSFHLPHLRLPNSFTPRTLHLFTPPSPKQTAPPSSTLLFLHVPGFKRFPFSYCKSHICTSLPRRQHSPVMVSRVFVLAILVTLFSFGPANATTCLSKKFYTSRLKQVVSDARRLKFHPSFSKCIWKSGIALKPAPVRLSPTTKVVCYEDAAVIKYVTNVVRSCFVQFKNRRPSGSRSAKTGREVVLEETNRNSCGCTSGCHYCCVMTGVGGLDYCFSRWCGRYRYCY